ncbi:hypothetical protein J6590_026498 [Homalodisca vitripennis]|nr:hypothetical protein J6590_026498 [Homalodisca vitripennis]
MYTRREHIICTGITNHAKHNELLDRTGRAVIDEQIVVGGVERRCSAAEISSRHTEINDTRAPLSSTPPPPAVEQLAGPRCLALAPDCNSWSTYSSPDIPVNNAPLVVALPPTHSDSFSHVNIDHMIRWISIRGTRNNTLVTVELCVNSDTFGCGWLFAGGQSGGQLTDVERKQLIIVGLQDQHVPPASALAGLRLNHSPTEIYKPIYWFNNFELNPVICSKTME